MKKKIRRLKTSETTQQTGKVQTAAVGSEEKMPFGNRGKLWKTVSSSTVSILPNGSETEKAADSDFKAKNEQKHPESKSRSSGEWLRGNRCSEMNFIARNERRSLFL